MDNVNESQRSKIMARIPGKNTKPELIVRKLVHALGFRFRLHRRDLPGTPDLVLPRHRKVILVHGCFWHHHADCRYAYTPKTRTEFWLAKFARNIANDDRALRLLTERGWDILTIWECEVRDPDMLAQRVQEFLVSKRS